MFHLFHFPVNYQPSLSERYRASVSQNVAYLRIGRTQISSERIKDDAINAFAINILIFHSMDPIPIYN